MYSEKVMDHFQHPRNVGEIENASGVGTVGNAKCGDIMRMYLDIDDNGIITAVEFDGGCNGNQTGISRLVVGKPAEEIISILKGTTCGKRPTSCPDQLARALQEAIDAL